MNVKNKHTASILTNLFGGSISNEGLGLFALSFDWNNIGQVSLPLKWQVSLSVRPRLIASSTLDSDSSLDTLS